MLNKDTSRWLSVLAATALALAGGTDRLAAGQPEDFARIETQFRELPMEAKRLTGPLFWLHGDESPQRLQTYLDKVAQGGNGCFTAESRPHNDWLGPGWYRDLGICLQAAKRLDLKMWIFDERWWPSGEVDGKVPQQYGSKYMEAAAADVDGPGRFTQDVAGGKLIAVIAGEVVGEVAGEVADNGLAGDGLVDLTPRACDGRLTWDAPAGKWKVMTFTWRYSEGRRGRLLVDGASRDAVDWYLRTVYQPHYDHFKDEFGKTIVGYFYDEPETYGDWGTEVIPELKARGVDWKKALVAWKFQLADQDEHVAAKYQYQDAFAEAWGRTLYGGLSRWCHEHRVLSIGHWLEHGREYLHPKLCAGNMFQVQKYTDMGGIDAVFRQFVPGRKDDSTYQTPKLGSSISHVYGKADDLTMVEIFGARGQDLSYPEMKWWTDLMHVAGVNFHIPHSFNPRSPYDRDCPPYFYNDGYEPRWPLYRVYADYTSRLSIMLSGGHHVCPVAFLFLGNSFHVGKAVTPEKMTTALQDALFDCDWMPYDVFEGDVKLVDRQLHLHRERYQVLVVPAVEVIPHATLAKARAFFDAGGVVIGYGRLPSRSATPGKTSTDIKALREAIWGDAAEPGLEVCGTSAAGGRSYFLPEEPTPQQIQRVLTADAGIHPTLEVLQGDTDDWLHVLHRVKAGRDMFLICNQHHDGPTKKFRFRARARGFPECWDALRNEITSVLHRRVDDETVNLAITLQPLESVLIVFQPTARKLPARVEAGFPTVAPPIEVTRLPAQVPRLTLPESGSTVLADCAWVWHAGDPGRVPPCKRYFRGVVELPSDQAVAEASIRLTADNDFVLYVNGKEAGRGTGGYEDWRRARTIDLSPLLRPGKNTLAIEAANFDERPNPAGLIGAYRITFDRGSALAGSIDKQWKSSDGKAADWQRPDFDDGTWLHVKEIARYGQEPWGPFEDPRSRLTLPPANIQADPLAGRFTLPDDWKRTATRVYLEAEGISPEPAAAVQVNGRYVGGFIGKPFRLDLTRQVRPGDNTIQIAPFAPSTVRIVLYPDQP